MAWSKLFLCHGGLNVKFSAQYFKGFKKYKVKGQGQIDLVKVVLMSWGTHCKNLSSISQRVQKI
jgi:hypothetical protein